jgi:hypothetical protein
MCGARVNEIASLDGINVPASNSLGMSWAKTRVQAEDGVEPLSKSSLRAMSFPSDGSGRVDSLMV